VGSYAVETVRPVKRLKRIRREHAKKNVEDMPTQGRRKISCLGPLARAFRELAGQSKLRG